jgi:hypothetical protein
LPSCGKRNRRTTIQNGVGLSAGNIGPIRSGEGDTSVSAVINGFWYAISGFGSLRSGVSLRADRMDAGYHRSGSGYKDQALFLARKTGTALFSALDSQQTYPVS